MVNVFLTFFVNLIMKSKYDIYLCLQLDPQTVQSKNWHMDVIEMNGVQISFSSQFWSFLIIVSCCTCNAHVLFVVRLKSSFPWSLRVETWAWNGRRLKNRAACLESKSAWWQSEWNAEPFALRDRCDTASFTVVMFCVVAQARALQGALHRASVHWGGGEERDWWSGHLQNLRSGHRHPGPQSRVWHQ